METELTGDEGNGQEASRPARASIANLVTELTGDGSGITRVVEAYKAFEEERGMRIALADLGATLDAMSWEWLCDTHPILAESVEAAVNEGVCPEQIRRFVMRRTERRELALRCEQAARYLEPAVEG